MRLGSPFYTHRRARKQGARDGRDWRWKFWPPAPPFREPKQPTPAQDQQGDSTFETVLKDAVEADMQRIATHWKVADEKLKPAYCTALAECNLNVVYAAGTLLLGMTNERVSANITKAGGKRSSDSLLSTTPKTSGIRASGPIRDWFGALEASGRAYERGPDRTVQMTIAFANRSARHRMYVLITFKRASP